MPLLGIVALGVLTAYVVSLVGPPPKPVQLTQDQLDLLNAQSQAAATLAAHQAIAQQQNLYLPPIPGPPNPQASPPPGQLFEPGFQGQPGVPPGTPTVGRCPHCGRPS